MKKKLLVLLSAIAVIAVSAAVFSACSRGEGHEHALTEHKALEATCTEAGNIAYWECEECGKIFSDAEGNSELAPLDTVILPSGHTLGNWIVDEEPTCAQEGSRHKECTLCGAVLERGAISKSDHVLVIDRGIEPTCTSMGKTEGIHCSACNKVLLAQKSIPKLDHTPGEWIVDREATCVREGIRHTECEECGNVLKTETLDKLPHSYVDRICENCGALDYSKGLEFKSNYNGTYTLTGIGTCSDEKVIVPDTYNGKPVTEIGREAFGGCLQITHLILPESVVEIGTSAFEDCSSLCSVVFSDVTESIGMYAFANCSLQTLRIPDSVTSIEYGAFSDCTALTSVVLSSSLDKISGSVFSGCSKLQSVVVPGSVETIEKFAFADCGGLETVTFGEGLRTIGHWSFTECIRLTRVVVPDTVTTINSSAFNECISLREIVLSDALETIGEYAFTRCAIESIEIPSSIKRIETGVFYGCTSLTSVSIPESLSSIGDSAFGNCTSLENVSIPETVQEIGRDAFTFCGKLQQATFADTQGWQYTSAPAGAEMIAISETMLSDPAAAAKCLRSDYATYYWIKG